MNIEKATRKYETWLAARMPLIAADLRLKHERMREAAFPFLRATFYRWCQLWHALLPEEVGAPEVLAVGDLHVENFGTWRDPEGRLVWGINDFDETAVMPFSLDLVRLAASAKLAAEAEHVTASAATICDDILEGYHAGLKAGGRPIVLSEHNHWLRQIAVGELRDPARFWAKMGGYQTCRKPPPGGALKALEKLLPGKNLDYRIVHRAAGLGSLGRQRFTLLAEWHGGMIAREAKRLTSSAYFWAAGRKGNGKILYQEALNRAVRCHDPFVRLRGEWIVRRLAPDCSKIEIAALPKKGDVSRLLREMGWEIANVHLGSKDAAKTILRNLAKRRPNWLNRAAETMTRATIADWNEWTDSE